MHKSNALAKDKKVWHMKNRNAGNAFEEEEAWTFIYN